MSVFVRKPTHGAGSFDEELGGREPFDRDYWLSHCEGFRVDFVDGVHGFVEEVRHALDPDRAPVLAVRVGRLGRRVVLVPVDDVAFVVPRAEHIWVETAGAPGSARGGRDVTGP